MRNVTILVTCWFAIGCIPEEPQTNLRDLAPGAQSISLFGDTLFAPPQAEEVRAVHGGRLAIARDIYLADTTNADALIWFGRRTAYLGDYREAIEIYTKGIKEHPRDARMYRHRGHRYLSVRRFDLAIDDLEHASRLIHGQPDEVEPDGIPNARNIPTGTLHFNIWYHLGLAHYLEGEFREAMRAYRECMAVSNNPDALVATSYWLYMTLQRLGLPNEAARILERITVDMDIIENGSYHELLLLNKNELAPEDLLRTGDDDSAPLASATVGYGLGHWHWSNGRPEEAALVWQDVLAGAQSTAFGYVAAEAELARTAH
ncbi:MAG: tetratricopeptide repeat protein [Gemmatimonadetes bacterium]|nr:tetratricopeptide repeat protein [Gemmatimonadota bacterium]